MTEQAIRTTYMVIGYVGCALWLAFMSWIFSDPMTPADLLVVAGASVLVGYFLVRMDNHD